MIRRVGSIRLAGLPAGVDRPRDPAAGPSDGLDAEEAERQRELFDCGVEMDALRAAGIPVESYDGDLGRGIFLPSNAVMNPPRRALGLARLAVGSGRARLFEHSKVSSIRPGVVTTTGGEVHASVIVVAVDGGLDVVLPQLAGQVRTARLQMLAATPGRPRRLPCAVYGRWGYDYAQQDAAGRLLVGGGRDRYAEREWTHDTEPTAGVQSWIEHVASRMAGQPVEVTHRWAASVGFTPDGKALCTRVDAGVVACGGYSGGAARAAVALALDGTPPPAYFTA